MLRTPVPSTGQVLALAFVFTVVGCTPPEPGSEYPGHRRLSQALAPVPDAGTPTNDDCDGGNSSVWCPGGEDPGEWSEEMNANVFGARGEYTSPSYITSAPVGAASLARNVVVDVPGEYTTRKGFEYVGPALPGGVEARAMTHYQGTLIVYAADAKLYHLTGGSWTAFAGTYYPPVVGEDANGDDVTGVVQFTQLNQTLYFTTAAGVYRLESLTGTPQLAGVVPGTAGTATLTGTAGNLLPGGCSTAYRCLWGRRAENGNLMLGAPSDRTVVENPYEEWEPVSVVRAANVTTVEFDAAHGLEAGDTVSVFFNTDADAANFDSGEKEITAVTTTAPHTITYADVAANATASEPDEILVRYVPETQDVDYLAPVPPDADANYFLQLYRSEVAPNGETPSDEMALVYERAWADMPVAVTDFSVTDGTPDDLRATALYTNATAGEGAIASRNAPPLAAVQTIWKNRTVYANLRFPDTIPLTLLAAGGTTGINSGQGVVFTFSDGTSEAYTGWSSEAFPNQFKVYTSGTPSERVTNTVASLAAAINSRTNGRLRASVGEGGTLDGLGSITVTARSVAEETFSVSATQRGDMWAPALPYQARVTAGSMARDGGLGLVTVFVSTTVPGVGHGFKVGQQVRFETPSDPDDTVDFPAGVKTITQVPTVDSFRYVEAGPTATNDATVYFSSISEPAESDDDYAPGGWAASEQFSPDAVTQTTANIAGDRYKRTLGFLTLGESLFILKEDGLFRLVGDGPQNYTVESVDNTVSFVAPRAALVIGQTAYALTTQGLMAWTENGKPVPASVPIESELRALVENAREAVDTHAFALNHDARRRAYFFLPTAAEDTSATQVLVYNTLTDTWTRWDKAAVSALVEPSTDRLILAPAEVDGLAAAPMRERATGTNADFEDEDGSAIQAEVTFLPFVGSSPSVLKQISWTHAMFAGTLPTEVEFGFGSNWNPTPTWFPVSNQWSQRPGAISTPPTIAHSRGNTFTVGIRHAQVGEPLRLLGFAHQYREYGQ